MSESQRRQFETAFDLHYEIEWYLAERDVAAARGYTHAGFLQPFVLQEIAQNFKVASNGSKGVRAQRAKITTSFAHRIRDLGGKFVVSGAIDCASPDAPND